MKSGILGEGQIRKRGILREGAIRKCRGLVRGEDWEKRRLGSGEY
jgi:hypothetical protein